MANYEQDKYRIDLSSEARGGVERAGGNANSPIDIKLGRGFPELLSKIEGARERVWIMSPWISAENAQLLVKKAREGVDVRVFTTDDLENRSHASALMELIEPRDVVIKKGSPLARKAGFLLLLLGIASSFVNPLIGILALLTGAALYLVLGRDKRGIRYFPRVGEGKLLIFHSEPQMLVHAKVYVIDGKAALGSVNFTRSGVEGNFECLAWIKEPSVVEDVVNRLKQLERDPQLEKVRLNDIGKVLMPVRKSLLDRILDYLAKL